MLLPLPLVCHERRSNINAEFGGRLARRPTGFLLLKGALQGVPKLYVYVALWLSIVTSASAGLTIATTSSVVVPAEALQS